MPRDLEKNLLWSVDFPRLKRFGMPFELKSWMQLLVIFLTAALLSLPCLIYGLPPAADAPTHVKYQYHFSSQFWNGESYPRWLAEENKGYGSPIFLVQYPLPYFVTALLRPITSFPPANRESRELGLFTSLALAAAGVAAWLWLRKFTHSLAAMLAAVVYISMPFILGSCIYVRGGIGELCTFAWMPLALSICETMHKRRSAIFALSGVFALMVVSNLLGAILFAPVLTIYAISNVKWSEFSLHKRILLVFLAQFLGAGMAGAYLLPSLAFRHFFDLTQMQAILPGFQFGLYFLNITSSNLSSRVVDIALVGAVLYAGIVARHIWVSVMDFRIRVCMAVALILAVLALIPNLGTTIVRLSGFNLRPAPLSDAVATMLLGVFFTIALGFLAYCRIAEKSVGPPGPLLLCITVASFFLMLPFSAPIWKAVPGSALIQFPFRFAGVACVAVAGLVSLAFDDCLRDPNGSPRLPSRLLIALAAFASIAGSLGLWRADRAFRHPRNTDFDVTQDIDPMYRAYVPLQQMVAFAKDIGTTPEAYDVGPTQGDGTLRAELVKGECDLKVTRESPRELLVSSDCRGEARLRIGQLYSPLWKIVPPQADPQNQVVGVSADSLIELPLQRGKHDTRLAFDMGPAEHWGNVLSEVSLSVGLIGFMFFYKQRSESIARSSDETSVQWPHAQ